jgi:hypothetical protein
MVPLEPDEPAPLEPLAPLDPLGPDEPLELAPDPALAVEAVGAPRLPVGAVGDESDLVGESVGDAKRSFVLLPAPLHATLHAATSTRTPDATTAPAERDLMAAQLYGSARRCPTPIAHESDSFPSRSA